MDEPVPLGEKTSPASLILPIRSQRHLLVDREAGRAAMLDYIFVEQNLGNIEECLPDGLNGKR